MKALAGCVFVLLLSIAGWAQPRGGIVNPQPFVQGSFGNVIFPGGTAALPGVHRTLGNAVFPSGAGFPNLVVPGSVTDPTYLSRRFGRQTNGPFGQYGQFGSRRNNALLMPYAYPVYVGGFYDNPYVGGDPSAAVPPPSQQAPNITVIYPPMQQPVTVAPPPEDLASAPSDNSQTASSEPAPSAAQQYLIAFKDHTIYSAVAFWVDGDTLHYFTSGNTHNQVSLSLIDKALTERLNRESGIDMHLPQ